MCVFLQEDLPLHSNFIPLDIRLQNWEELPPEFNHSENRRQVCVCARVCVCVCVCVCEREKDRIFKYCFIRFLEMHLCVCVCVCVCQVVRFVREWSSLTAMRQRMVRKSGRVFHSPILLLEELTQSQRRHSSTSRQETHTYTRVGGSESHWLRCGCQSD